MNSTNPATGRRSEQIAFSGESLGKSALEKLYLTDGEHDYEVTVVHQTPTMLMFRIPARVPPGRFAFMLTNAKGGTFVELPRFRLAIDATGAFQISDREGQIRATCAAIYRKTADKKLGDLTVKEEQDVRNCQRRGLYPPR